MADAQKSPSPGRDSGIPELPALEPEWQAWDRELSVGPEILLTFRKRIDSEEICVPPSKPVRKNSEGTGLEIFRTPAICFLEVSSSGLRFDADLTARKAPRTREFEIPRRLRRRIIKRTGFHQTVAQPVTPPQLPELPRIVIARRNNSFVLERKASLSEPRRRSVAVQEAPSTPSRAEPENDERQKVEIKVAKVREFWARTSLLIPNVFRVLCEFEAASVHWLEFQDLSNKVVLVTGSSKPTIEDGDTKATDSRPPRSRTPRSPPQVIRLRNLSASPGPGRPPLHRTVQRGRSGKGVRRRAPRVP